MNEAQRETPIETSRARPRAVGPALLFFLLIALSVAAANHFVKTGLSFSTKSPIPIETNPDLFELAVGIAAGTVLAALVVSLLRPHWVAYVLPSATALVLLGIGALLASIQPSAGSLVARDELRAPTTDPPPHVFAIAVFFPTNSSVLERKEAKHLIELFEVFRTCGAGNIRVRGFASSAPFRGTRQKPISIEESNNRNTALANRRGIAVHEEIERVTGIDSTLEKPWGDYGAMSAARRVRDTDADGRLLPKYEVLNRRVELFWNATTCINVPALAEVDGVK